MATILALCKQCDIYLIDEPSAYLDAEYRIHVAQILKRWIIYTKRCAIIVEHDIIMGTFLADKVIVFEGIPGIDASCSSPEGLTTGMNRFLKKLDITYRRDL